MAGDIYVDNGAPYNRVDVWRVNASSSVSTLSIGGQCFSVFIDANNSLYCSWNSLQKVIRRSLNSSDSQVITVAGTGCSGYLPDMLNSPHGVYVDINFDLYVADTNNHRIQLFQQGQLNGTTVAGGGAISTILLHKPTSVLLDFDGYMFIVDGQNNRIIGSSADGFRCIIGCTGTFGSASDKLNLPRSMAFDSYGNIFVTDINNVRVQKFILSTNSCSKSYGCMGRRSTSEFTDSTGV
jgi:hypothetical protein